MIQMCYEKPLTQRADGLEDCMGCQGRQFISFRLLLISTVENTYTHTHISIYVCIYVYMYVFLQIVHALLNLNYICWNVPLIFRDFFLHMLPILQF